MGIRGLSVWSWKASVLQFAGIRVHPGLHCVVSEGCRIVICRNPWASVAGAGSLKVLLCCKLQESVGIRGISSWFGDAFVL